MMPRFALIPLLAVLLTGCGGKDELGLVVPSLTENDLYGVWFQSNVMDGNKNMYEKYEISGVFVYATRGRNDSGTFRFLDNLNVERTVTSSEYYNTFLQTWIRTDISDPKPDTINFHLNAGGFWVRGYTILDSMLYVREWRKVDSLPYMRP